MRPADSTKPASCENFALRCVCCSEILAMSARRGPLSNSWLDGAMCNSGSRCRLSRQSGSDVILAESIVVDLGPGADTEGVDGNLWPQQPGKGRINPVPKNQMATSVRVGWFDSLASGKRVRMPGLFAGTSFESPVVGGDAHLGSCVDPVIREHGKPIGMARALIHDYGDGVYRVALRGGAQTARLSCDIERYVRYDPRGGHNGIVLVSWEVAQ